MIDPKKILVPFDFSPRSIEALEYALSLARNYSASLTLLHVASTRTAQSIFRIHATAMNEVASEKVLRYCEKRFDEMLVDIDTSGVEIDRRVVYGCAHIEIVRAAVLGEVDLIVICTHGYTGLDHLLHGSISEKVVRTAPCPVLVIKAADHKLRLPGKTKRINKDDANNS